MSHTFYAKAVWDPEAKVYYSESDILGLHVEAKTVGEFSDLVRELAAELIIANHLSAKEMAETPLKELLPAILLHLPETAPLPA